MGYNDKAKEYVITDMYPKRPWMNYLWSEDYIAIINQFGFGKGRFSGENDFQRNIVRDSDSRIIFIKCDDEIYAANRNYGCLPFTEFKTVVGMGYSKIVSEYNGLRTELLIFVPEHGRRECWQLSVSNTSKTEKSFDVYAFADIDSQLTEHLACNQGTYADKLNGIVFTHKVYNTPTEYNTVYFASNEAAISYETTKKRFIGVYGNPQEPTALNKPVLDSLGTSFDADTAAILQHRVILAPGASQMILYTAGVEKSLDAAVTVSDLVLKPEKFLLELENIKKQADKYDRRILIHTPDEEIDRFANIWLKRQMELGKTWGRVYNKGFRDIMQDISGFVQLDPAISRRKILYCTQYQKADGNTLRSWVPLDLRPYRDGAVWLLSTVTAYIKETADISILDEKIGYFGSDITETLFEHCIRGINFLYRETGEHGLCLWGGGDWNDSFDGAGLMMKGESVWLSIAAVKSTNDFISLLKFLNKNDLIDQYTQKRNTMIKNINTHGRDTDHYIYGINDWGERVGSYDTPTGNIFLNPQTWAVLAGIADSNDELLDLAERELRCPFGYVQQKPCYCEPDPHLGRISYFGKGFYENGSVYNHGVAFKIVADCVAGRGDHAYKTLKMLLPENPDNDYTQSGVEPYALCNMFFGPENTLKAGEAPMHWITGTGSWVFRAIIEYILGIQADFNGLLIEPHLPSHWQHAQITRMFRGDVYEISINRTGRKRITADGSELDGNIIPIFCDEKKHQIIVEI